MAESSKPRNPRSLNNYSTDPNSLRYKPTNSSVLPSNGGIDDASTAKKKSFTSSTFRGLGCAASSEVSVPAAIRNSANWESKKPRRKVARPKKSSGGAELFCYTSSVTANDSNENSNPLPQSSLSLPLSSSCLGVGVPDVWCGPGIGLTTDAASVDCVVSTRPASVSARGKIDGQRKHSPSSTLRRMVTSEDITFFEPEEVIRMPRFHADVSRTRHNNLHIRHGFRDRLAEIVMLRRSLLLEGSPAGLDLYRDLRLDVDNMSYEELLELGDRIGYVNTGLGEDEITHCLKCSKNAKLGMERKCSICQEECESDDETGKLDCGHSFHIDCIRQWLVRKNVCPICKTAALSQI